MYRRKSLNPTCPLLINKWKNTVFWDVTPCSLVKTYNSSLNMEATYSSEILINLYQTTQCHTPEDIIPSITNIKTFPTFSWRVWGKPLASRRKIKLSIQLWKSRSAAPSHFNHEGKTYLHRHFPVQWIDHADHKSANPDHNSIVFGLSGRCKTHCVITMDNVQSMQRIILLDWHDMHSVHRHVRLCTEAMGGPLKQCCIFSNKTYLLILVSH